MSSDGVILEEVKQSAWEVDLPLDPSSEQQYWILHSPEFPFERMKYRLELYTDWTCPGWIFQKLYMKGPSVSGPPRIVRWQVGTKRGEGTGIQWIGSGEDTVEEECRGWRFLYEWELFEISGPKKDSNVSQTRERLAIFLQLRAGRTGMDASTQTEVSSHCLLTLGQNLKGLYLDQKDWDVTIEVGGVSFRAHRAILNARNPVLEAMLRTDMEELNSGVIRIRDCEPEAFEVFLLFLYTGTVENLTSENVTGVYGIAKRMLSELKEICVRHMMSSLSIDSICDTVSFATSIHDERELLGKAIQFFMENAQEILDTEQWQRFKEDNPTKAKVLKTLKGYTGEINCLVLDNQLIVNLKGT